MKKPYIRRRGKTGTGRRGGGKILTIQPGADAKLKKIFAGIGVPEQKPFTSDPFQTKAVAAIRKADCLVSAPTGSGKTWIALQAIRNTLKKSGKSWYASPLKALSNAKYSEFRHFFGEEAVGVLTGDRKENPDAPVIVGTTEILRNQLYDAMSRGEVLDADFVVLDEAHFLGDPDRGVVWEEIMIYLPHRIPLLMLSATIGNADQIADWLSVIRSRPCVVVKETRRPVPLHAIFFHPSGTLRPLATRTRSGKTRIHKKVNEYLNAKRPLLLAPPGKLPPFGDVLKVLRKYNLLPAIFFLKSRADCDNALDLCMENMSEDAERNAAIRRKITEMASQCSYISAHRQLWHIENLAVGAHHSGQLPAWKLVIENLMTDGLLDAVFATSTVAAGVNFPARTIVFLNSDRFNGKEFLPLDPTEFHQMTGRAGRRGMDNVGFAVIIPGKFMDARLIARLMTSPPSPVYSQIKINFSMVLNLLLSHSPEGIEDLLECSFAAHVTDKKSKRKSPDADLRREFLKHMEFLTETGFADKTGRLTEDGVWASQLRVDQPLMIAEGFRLGVFPESDPALLAAVMAAFVNEEESDDRINLKDAPKRLVKAMLTVTTGLKPFAAHMNARGFDARPLFFRPAASTFAWAMGQPWETVAARADTAEGNLAMLMLRTADNLRHIRSLYNVFPKASETATKAIDLILRDPVATYFEF